MMGLLGENEWKRKWQRLYDQGVTNIDLRFVFLDILLPLVLLCSDHLLVPYFLSRTICFYIRSYELQTLVTRYSFLIYFLIFKVFDSVKAGLSYFHGLYNQVRDSRYLIGTELTNR